MAEKNIVDTAIIHRTRYEIETFVLGEHPHPARQAQLLINEIRRVKAGVVIESGEHVKAGLEAELKILEDILADMSQKHDVPALLENIETYEEQYWVDRLARMAAIDILTIGLNTNRKNLRPLEKSALLGCNLRQFHRVDCRML